MLQSLPPKVARFMSWSFAIWGAGDSVNEGVNGRYVSAVISCAIGVAWIWAAGKCGDRN